MQFTTLCPVVTRLSCLVLHRTNHFSGIVRRVAAPSQGCHREFAVKGVWIAGTMSDHDCLEIQLPCTGDPFTSGVDEVIDVRTPQEYAEDHVPGAINLPVLNDEERHNVGKEYSVNSFEARRNGAALISSNISNIINAHFMDKPKSHSVLVYCWRGGQRSKSLALVLSMIGYSVKYLRGGYKTYRSRVISDLSELPSQFTYKVIEGMTGCGKTFLLQLLEDAGEQILDLEGLANHKGSVLGLNYPNIQQPSAKMFESCLLNKFKTFDPAFPVWVEAEGRRIGRVQVPNSVFEQISKNATVSYILQSSIEMRVKFTINSYDYFTLNPAELKKILERLGKLNAPLKRWYKLIDEGKFEDFVLDILKNHYDPSYKKSCDKSLAKDIRPNNKVEINLERIDKECMQNAFSKVLESSSSHVYSANADAL